MGTRSAARRQAGGSPANHRATSGPPSLAISPRRRRRSTRRAKISAPRSGSSRYEYPKISICLSRIHLIRKSNCPSSVILSISLFTSSPAISTLMPQSLNIWANDKIPSVCASIAGFTMPTTSVCLTLYISKPP